MSSHNHKTDFIPQGLFLPATASTYVGISSETRTEKLDEKGRNKDHLDAMIGDIAALKTLLLCKKELLINYRDDHETIMQHGLYKWTTYDLSHSTWKF